MNELDNKYFINDKKFNCPHCRMRSVKYTVLGMGKFNETNDKVKSAMFVRCENDECKKISLHLINGVLTSYFEECNFVIQDNTYNYSLQNRVSFYDYENKVEEEGLDAQIILHIPTSFFTIDSRIPRKIREPLNEATICHKNGAITGASACIRKAIYEFLFDQKATGRNYDEKIKSIKGNWSHISEYLSVLEGIKGMTSGEVHEGSFENIDRKDISNYVEILKEIFNEVYVIPSERRSRKERLMTQYGNAKKDLKETFEQSK